MLTLLGKPLNTPWSAEEIETKLIELRDWKSQLVSEGNFEQSAAVRDEERRLIKELERLKGVLD